MCSLSINLAILIIQVIPVFFILKNYQHFPERLDLILSLFFYCCRCPRYWGRQQVARVLNTQSPGLSVQWMDAAKAAHFHVSFNTLRGLPLPLALGIVVLVSLCMKKGSNPPQIFSDDPPPHPLPDRLKIRTPL